MYNQRRNQSANFGTRLQLTNIFRSLWNQHMVWTRAFVVSSISKLEDLPYVTQRLLRNPSDFARELKRFYGPDKARMFEQLLTEHLTIAAEMLNYILAGNMRDAEVARIRWYRNADDIAVFLSNINPFWSKKMWQRMLYEHLRMLEQEISLYLTKQYEASIAIFDEIEAQGAEMADMMTEGIIKQFNL